MFETEKTEELHHLKGLSEQHLSIYDNYISEIITPPIGVNNPESFFIELPKAKDIHDNFISSTPIYNSPEDAIDSDFRCSLTSEEIRFARENYSQYFCNMKVPELIVNKDLLYLWNSLYKSLPINTVASLCKDRLILDFPIIDSVGNENSGTMIINLSTSNKRQGMPIDILMQSRLDGVTVCNPLLDVDIRDIRFNRDVRSTEEGSIATANCVNCIKSIDMHSFYINRNNLPHYFLIPTIYHEISHLTDNYEKNYYHKNNAEEISKIRIILENLSSKNINEHIFKFIYKMLVSLDNENKSEARSAKGILAKQFRTYWLSEMRARFAEKISADILNINGFIAPSRPEKYILNVYQPTSWLEEETLLLLRNLCLTEDAAHETDSIDYKACL